MKRQWRFQGAALALATGLMALVSMNAQADWLAPRPGYAPLAVGAMPSGAQAPTVRGAIFGRAAFEPAAPYLADDHEEERRRYEEERRYRERDQEDGDRPRYYAPFFYGAPEGDRGNYGDRGPSGDHGHFGNRGNFGDRSRFGEERR